MPAFSYYHKNEKDQTDFNGYIPVSVVANFNVSGEFVPVYMQVLVNEERITYKIDGIKRIDNKLGAVVFDCFIKDGNYRKEITLYYLVSRSIWAIKK